MSATSNWAKNAACVVTLASAQKCTDGSFSGDVSEFDTTNLTSPTTANGLLFTEQGVDTVTVKLDFSVVVDKNAIQVYTLGALIAGVTYAGDDGVSYSGSARIMSIGKPISTKGAFKISLKTVFTGSVSGV